MDRNAVIATVLIAIILIVWFWWMAPPPPAQPVAQEDPFDTTQVELPDAPTGLDAADTLATGTEADSVAAPVDDAFAPPAGDARFVTVDTDLYTATFSTRGGTPVNFVLKEYRKFDQLTPVEMISEEEEGALGLFFSTPDNRTIDTRDYFYEVDVVEDTLLVTGEEGTALTFALDFGEGQIRQTYTFTPGSYDIGFQVEQENAAAFATSGYEVVWYGGIPFNEGNPEDEAMRSGAFARLGGDVVSVTLDGDEYEEETANGQIDWMAVKDKYFAAVVIPVDVPTRGAALIGEQSMVPALDSGVPVVAETFTTRLEVAETRALDQYRLYVGPMEFYRITDYGLGLYDMVDYGWDAFVWMTRPLAKFIFIPIFNFLGGVLPNYGLVIILLAFLVKAAVWPLTRSSYRSMARMRELQPKMEAIKEKYADNPQKQQEAMMKMYRETGVNPLGGCLPMLFQYPVIIALWQFLPQSIEIRQQGFLWANDLSAPDVILDLPFTIPFYGDFVAGFTLLMGLSMVVQMRLQSNPAMANAQAKVFMYLLPAMLFFFFNRLAAGLSLYYLTFNILSAFQQKLINKEQHKEAEEAEASMAPAKRSTNGKGTKSDTKAKSIRRKSAGTKASAAKSKRKR